MAWRTVFLSRFIGLSTVVVSMCMLREAAVGIESAIVHDDTLLVVGGLFWSLVGLAIVLGHNVWSGGLLPVVVTEFGWFALARGLIQVWIPREWAVWFFEISRFSERHQWYACIILAFGMYLTVAGFRRSLGPSEASAIASVPAALLTADAGVACRAMRARRITLR